MRRRRRRRIRLVLLVLVAGLVAFHVPILRGIGRLLIVDSAVARPDAVFVLSGDGLYSKSAQAALANPDLIVLKPEFTKLRLEQMGIWPDRIAEFHRELTRRGVPDRQQKVLYGPARSEWQAVELLDQWLVPGSQQKVTALCDEFQTRRLKLAVDSVMKARSAQVGIQPLTDRRYDPSNWWKSRGGIRTVILNAVSLAIASFHRAAPPAVPEWDPDDYERSLSSPERLERTADARASGWLASIGHWLDIGKEPHKVDHLVLLPGDENVRPFVAAALVKAAFARDILLPQNFPSPAIEDGLIRPTHEVTAEVLRRRGVGSDKLRVLAMKSDGTIDDARATKEVLDQEPAATVAVVTSFYHTRRARMSFRAVYGSRADEFLYISAPVTDIDADHWWQSDTGTQMIASELVKVGLYWVAYGPGVYWLVAMGAGLIGLWRWRRSARKRRKRETQAAAEGAPRAATA
jgi:uncharacterized SAM-binding protein YcdF (DUF218 family)